MKATLSVKNNYIKIYINGIIHVCLKRDEFIGFQSYYRGYNSDLYVIEFYMKMQIIKVEYDLIDKWKAVLKLLDKEGIVVV